MDEILPMPGFLQEAIRKNREILSVERVGIIGDVHTEDASLAAVLRFFTEALPDEFSPLDALLCVGDIVTGPGDAARCLDLLSAHEVITVRGNHDRWLHTIPEKYALMFPDATNRDELNTAQGIFHSCLPVTREFTTPRGSLLLCHGLGNDDMSGVYSGDSTHALESNSRLQALVGEGQYKFIANGHTHQRMVRDIYGLTIINAGTLRRDHNPGFLIADFAEGFVQSYYLNPTTAAITGGKRVTL